MGPNSDLMEYRANVIRENVGKMPTTEIAALLKISMGNLYNIASKKGIPLSVPRAPKPSRAKEPPAPQVSETDNVAPDVPDAIATTTGTKKSTYEAIERELEACSRTLRAHGWTVRRPDPFIELQERKGT